MELAHIVVVNKCDLDPDAARVAESQIRAALRASRIANPSRPATVPVLRVSARSGEGIEAFWRHMEQIHTQQRADGRLAARRREQALNWTWDLLRGGLLAEFHRHSAVSAALAQTLSAVSESRVAPATAARVLLELFRN
jgi:LAO/AO transport system kinase